MFALFCENENPRLGLGFQKASSVVLKKLPRERTILCSSWPEKHINN